MSDFEKDLLNSVKCSMVKQIDKTDFIQIQYDSRPKLPADFMQRAWEMVDQDSVIEKLSKRLEDELVDRLVNSIAAEMATDIKQVLSVKERREAVRSLVRDNIDTLTRLEK